MLIFISLTQRETESSVARERGFDRKTVDLARKLESLVRKREWGVAGIIWQNPQGRCQNEQRPASGDRKSGVNYDVRLVRNRSDKLPR